MTIKYHYDIEQGSEEWMALRRAILTASEMSEIVTPTLKTAANGKSRGHIYELVAQRITGFTEPSYVSNDIMRGQEDEFEARELYSRNYSPVKTCGFITNDSRGFKIGFSPDGLVGEYGLIEIKSRCQKYQMQTLLTGAIPAEYAIQLQTALLVSERNWIDFISYCGGLPMITIKVWPDDFMQAAILMAAKEFYAQMNDHLAEYDQIVRSQKARLIPTERRIEMEIFA
jgi:predicted phage-related endonuclease